MPTASQLWTQFKRAYNEWTEDKALRLSAALACYTILSLAPLVVITLKVLSMPFILGPQRAGELVSGQLTQLIGSQSANAIGDMIKSAAQPGSGVLATAVSIVILLFSASGVFAELQDSLNTIWEVKPRPDMSWWETIKKRFTSIGMVFVIIFLLLVSMFITAGLGGLIDSMFGDSGAEAEKGFLATAVGYVADFVVTTIVVGALFTLIFKYLPDVKLRFRDVWPGGVLTAVLFKFGQYALALYFYFGSTTSAYGAAGSLVAVLLWAYYSAAILFFGAEFTRVYVQTFGARAVPDKDAVPVTDEERAQHGMPRQRDVEESADAVAMGAGQHGGFARPEVRPPRVVTITQPAPGAGKAYAIAAIGVAAGLAVAAIGLITGRKYSHGGLEQIRLNHRLDQLESRVGRGRRLQLAATELRIHDRLNAMDAKVQQASNSLRRSSRRYAKPVTWIDRLAAKLARN